MEKRFDVLGIGCTAVDDLVYVDQYPPRDAKIPVRRRERQCGGLTGTALVAAARLGAKCAYAGALGHDELSEFVAQRLVAEGICLDYLRRQAGVSPVHSLIVVDDRYHTRNVFYDLTGAIYVDCGWPAEDVVRDSRVLFVDHLGVERMIEAARVARAAGIGVVADFEADAGPPFQELMGLIDHLVLSEDFAQAWTGCDNPVEAAQILWKADRETVVVTCGRQGCWYIGRDAPGQPRFQPAFRVREVDTTGCGDVFHGAYAAALARGWGVPARIEYAAATAALKATRPGGQAGIPTHAMVESFLAERKSDAERQVGAAEDDCGGA